MKFRILTKSVAERNFVLGMMKLKRSEKLFKRFLGKSIFKKILNLLNLVKNQ